MSAGREWMTAANSADTKGDSLNDAVALNGFFCVTRASWQKTAILTKKRADKIRIKSYKIYQDCLHRDTFLQCVFNDSHNNSLFTSPDCFCGNTTRSRPDRILLFFRKLSLIIRFILFRETAFRSFCLETTRPSRERSR
jgi:hypothetical protein